MKACLYIDYSMILTEPARAAALTAKALGAAVRLAPHLQDLHGADAAGDVLQLAPVVVVCAIIHLLEMQQQRAPAP